MKFKKFTVLAMVVMFLLAVTSLAGAEDLTNLLSMPSDKKVEAVNESLQMLGDALSQLGQNGQTEDAISVYVDGKKISLPDQKPYINKDNRTLVPVRFVSEALGAVVEWDNETQVVTIKQNSVTNMGELVKRNIKLRIGEKRADINGREVAFDTKAIVTPKNRTMVPLRFVSEALGADVRWVGSEQAVYISTSGKSASAVETGDDNEGSSLAEKNPGLEVEIIYAPDGGGGMDQTQPDNIGPDGEPVFDKVIE